MLNFLPPLLLCTYPVNPGFRHRQISSFYASDHNTLNKVLLHQRIYAHQRCGGNNDNRILQCLRLALQLERHLRVIKCAGIQLGLQQDLTQKQLQRIQFFFIQIQECTEIGVPVAYRIVHGNDRNTYRPREVFAFTLIFIIVSLLPP